LKNTKAIDDHQLEASLSIQIEALGEEFWLSLKSAHVLLTGCTGFIGSWFIGLIFMADLKYKLDLKIEVLTRDAERFLEKCPHFKNWSCLTFLKGEINSFDFSKISPNILVLGATSASDRDSDELEKIDLILNSTKLPLSKIDPVYLKYVLFLSSGAVYPAQERGETTFLENAHIDRDRLTPYGKGKRLAEEFCVEWAREKQIPVGRARCFTFSGTYLMPDSGYALTDFIEEALADKTCPAPNGPYETLRSYLDGADGARYLWTMIQRKFEGPVNIGHPEPITMYELVKKVCIILKLNFNLKPKESLNAISQYLPNLTVLENQLNLFPVVQLDQSIKNLINWMSFVQKF